MIRLWWVLRVLWWAAMTTANDARDAHAERAYWLSGGGTR
jgi:hypothetical protein